MNAGTANWIWLYKNCEGRRSGKSKGDGKNEGSDELSDDEEGKDSENEAAAILTADKEVLVMLGIQEQ